ncbi:unnamed protein product [Polarella glacialis]|uniref:Yippee domain-containing protein n=1 Tax=Polarella glacialis TaxID=89957 RepID=A0A813IN85_POLGL|nr:unnamed protein product [Polarella glacialis]
MVGQTAEHGFVNIFCFFQQKKKKKANLTGCLCFFYFFLPRTGIKLPQHRAPRTGPGYLIAATQNTSASAHTQTVAYTTGTYTIREVSCEMCNHKLGVTYVMAPDFSNEYKVGKFLFGADRLNLPEGVTHPKAKAATAKLFWCMGCQCH